MAEFSACRPLLIFDIAEYVHDTRALGFTLCMQNGSQTGYVVDCSCIFVFECTAEFLLAGTIEDCMQAARKTHTKHIPSNLQRSVALFSLKRSFTLLAFPVPRLCSVV